MKYFRTLTILTLLLAASLCAVAAKFSVIPPTRVFEGGKFAVTFRVENGEGSGLSVSQINGCTLLYGPSTSQSHSYSIVNGQATQSSRVEYTYYYRADKAGTFTIPEASITVDGKKMTTKPVKFTVEPASAANAPAASRPTRIDDVDTQSSDRSVNSSDVFVRIILSRPTAYEQEAIECTIKLYTTYSISQFFPTRQPSFDGFLIEELNMQSSLNQEEVLNGRRYLTAVLKKCIIFPQKSGRLTINSGNYDITVVQYDNVNMGGFITVKQPTERKIKVSSNTASIDIKPLPTPQPEGFTGAVGTFKVDTRLVGNRFLTNDPATLIYTITGTGNIKYVKEPEIDFPSEFELYTPKSDIQAKISGNTVTGTMTLEYTFVPQSTGNFKIGSDKFVYFNPAEGRYVTITTPSYDIKVGQGAAQAATPDQEAISAKNKDIQHIKLGDKGLASSHTLVAQTLWYWLLYAVLLAALGSVIFVYRRNIRLNADLTGMRKARAGKVAKKRLATAQRYMSAANSDKFYEELTRALTGYLGDKLSIPVSRLSRENINAELAQIGAPETLTAELNDILDRCEMARYAPDSSAEVESVYKRAAEAINALQTIKTPAKKNA